MVYVDTQAIVPSLKTIESLAVIPRVASTNLVARRIVNECIENELSLPRAMILAGEQTEGRGRNERLWSSPADKGIYATTLFPCPVHELALVPLAIACAVASFLRETYGIDARIKWPNDVLAGGRKIAGILIEARVQEDRAFLLIGIGVNVEPVRDDASRPNAVAISELAGERYSGIDSATAAFVEHIDERLARTLDHDEVLSEWRALTIHRKGDRVQCVLPGRSVEGTWSHIDDQGRAVLQTSEGELAVSAGDLILAE